MGNILSSGTLFLLGIFLVTALFFITIYLGLDKKRAYLFFFSYAMLGGISLIALLKEFQVIFLAVTFLASISLLYFFASFFEKERSSKIAVFGFFLLLISFYNYQNISNPPKTIFYVLTWFVYILTLMACAWISLQGIKKNKFAGNLLFITITVIFVLITFLVSNSFFVSSLTISSVVLIFSVTYTVFNDFKKRQSLLKSLKIKSVQLENEMLKKTIQPHFLLNTLTILSEWIESQPELAVKQIELLSEEFRYIINASDKTLVDINEELKMCQVHLDIFNAKKYSDFKLETKGILPNTQIPPMIFHTLIENGLTHSISENGYFVFEQSVNENKIIFRISSQPLLKQTFEKEGLGINYIKSRLEQAFPGKWIFISQAKENVWETKIEIMK